MCIYSLLRGSCRKSIYVRWARMTFYRRTDVWQGHIDVPLSKLSLHSRPQYKAYIVYMNLQQKRMHNGQRAF